MKGSSRMIPDAWQFMRTLNARKIANIFRVRLSYRISLLRKKPVVWGTPYSISVEPVDFCNLACPECPAGLGQLTRPRESLDAGLFDKILDETAPNLAYMMLYFQGEPYLHRNIFNLMRMSVQRGVYTAISTNAQLLNDSYAEQTVRSGLHRIIISMDGITQETYEAYRRKGQLDKVLEGIANLRRWRKRLKSATPFIVVQFIVFRTNQHQLNGVRSFAFAAGADKVEIKTAQLYGYENGNPLMTDIDRYSRYRKTNAGRYEVKSKLPNRCFRLWNGTVITAAGNVVPCCFDKDALLTMGNISSQPLRQILKNNRYTRFRQNILDHRKNYDICRNCTEK